MDNGKIVELLRREKGSTSWRVLAARIGISQSYLYEIVRGTRRPGAKVLAYFGLEAVRSYKKVAE